MFSSEAGFVERGQKTQIELARDELLRILESTVDAEGYDAEALRNARRDLAYYFDCFPTLIPELTSALKKGYAGLGIDCGKTSVFMAGGRVVGKPLKPDSDIDLFVTHEKPIFPYGKQANVDAGPYREMKKHIAFTVFPSLLQQVGVTPSKVSDVKRVQIWQWEGNTPESFLASQQVDERAILLYEE